MPIQVKPEPPDRYHGIQQRPSYMPPQVAYSSMVPGRPPMHRFPASHPAQLNQRLPPPYSYPSQTRQSAAGSSQPNQATFPPLGSTTQPPHNAKPLLESTENQIDSQSAKGVFGWTTVDSISIPFLFRDEKKFVSVRMVEMKLLSKYPSSYPEELKDRPPLMSHYITVNEAKLLNEINVDHCDYDYGRQPFVQSDLIVKLTDFEEFYNIVKKNFPDQVLKQMNKAQGAQTASSIKGGWLQINNTVVPYVYKNSDKLVPLSVIKYAAGLLTDVTIEGLKPSEAECSYLNDQCQSAGLNFFFGKTTKMITLNNVIRSCNPAVSELPKNDPFRYAQYRSTPEEDTSTSSSMLIPNTISPSVQSNQTSQQQHQQQALGQQQGVSPGSRAGPITMHNSGNNNNSSPMSAPNPGFQHPGAIPPDHRLAFAATGGNPYWMGQHMGVFHHFSNRGNNVSWQRMRLPPPYGNMASSPQGHMNISNQGFPRQGLDSSSVLPNNQGSCVEGMAPPNRTVTLDMNAQLSNRVRRQSNESTGSNSSRPGSAVRMSPSRIHGSSPQIHSPNQQSPSAALGANPNRASQSQSPQSRSAASGMPQPVMEGVPAMRAPDQQTLSSMFAGILPQSIQAQLGAHPQHLMTSPAMQTLPPHQVNIQQHMVPPSVNTPLAATSQRRLSGASPSAALGSPAAAAAAQVSPPAAARQSPVSVASANPSQLVRVTAPNLEPAIQTNPFSGMEGVNINIQQKLQQQQQTMSINPQAMQHPTPPAQGQDKTPPPVFNVVSQPVTSVSSTVSNQKPPQIPHKNGSVSKPGADNVNPPVVPISSAIEISHVIKPIEFQGKTISCLTKDGESYALVEAIARVYFSQCTLQEFQNVLESVLFMPVTVLTDSEERAFIQFYKLPTNSLMCNKVVKLVDFENYLPQLRYMFKPKEATASTSSVSQATNNNKPGSSTKATNLDSVVIPRHIQPARVSPTHLGSLVANSSGQVAKGNDSGQNRAGVKRPATDDIQHTQAKQMPGKLEDTISRLKQKTDGPVTSDETTPPSAVQNPQGAAPVSMEDNVICLD